MDKYFMNLFDVSDVDVDLFIERELEEVIDLNLEDCIMIECDEWDEDTQVDIPITMFDLVNQEFRLAEWVMS